MPDPAPSSFYRDELTFINFNNIAHIWFPDRSTKKIPHSVPVFSLFGVDILWKNSPLYEHSISVLIETREGTTNHLIRLIETSDLDKKSFDWTQIEADLSERIKPLLDAYGVWLNYKDSLRR